MPDDQLSALLAAPGVSIHVLTRSHEPAGFYELDARLGHTVNLSYFGLLPHAIGEGLGTPCCAPRSPPPGPTSRAP